MHNSSYLDEGLTILELICIVPRLLYHRYTLLEKSFPHHRNAETNKDDNFHFRNNAF